VVTNNVDGPADPDACAAFLEVISAALDGEATTEEEARLDRHLADCASCRRFHDDAAALNRSVRLRSPASDPAFVARVMTDARPARLGRGGWMRPVLAWCAIVVGVQSFAPLVFGDSDGATAHTARHLGASGLALAVGLLYAAWRPHRAYGLLPFVGALFGATVIAAVVDMIDGDASAFAEATHVAELIGIVVLWMIAGSPGWQAFVNRLHRLHPHQRGPERHGTGALGSTR
jgi:predicted anti-sigma-YlaC factor YlaD